MLTDTTRKMASVQEIASLSPIENSDFLEIAMMKDLGWKVVVKKGEFSVGDKVVYFEIDSSINLKDLVEPLKFLADRGTRKLFTGRTPETSAFCEDYIRIKTIKLRGQVSQGLIIPWDAPIGEYDNGETRFVVDYLVPSDIETGPEGVIVGTDLTKAFHVEVWDRLVEWFDERSQIGPKACSHPAGDFPSDCPRTDETRIESLMKYFHDPEMTEATWECTEKNDGSSCTLFYRPMTWNPETGKEPMQIASRRFLLKDDGGSNDWFAAFKKIGWEELGYRLWSLYGIGLIRKSDFATIFPAGHELAIQGEMIGPKFNGNRDKNTETHFRVFRIFDITDQKFVSPEIRYAICDFLGLEHVKVIEICKIFEKCKTIDDFENYVDRESDNGNRIEGVVFKRVDDGTISFKKVSAKYLLKSED